MTVTSLRTCTAFSIALVLASIAAADPPTITDLAPESTILVVGVNHADATMQRFKTTPLWELWQTEQLAGMRTDIMAQMESGWDDMLEDLGLERDALQLPTGALGFAVFSMMDEEIGMPHPGFLVVADYGAGADKTAKLFDAVFQKARDKGELEYEEKEIAGRTVLCLDVIEEEEEAPADDMDEEEYGFDQAGMADPQEMVEQWVETLYFVREGSAFFLSSELDALQGAFETCDGADREDLTQREDFQAVSGQIGENDLYAVFLSRDFGELLSAVNPMLAMMGVGEMFKMIIGDIHGIGMGYQLDGEGGMVEGTASLYMPYGKAGLTALTDSAVPRGPVPRFVGPDALSYSFLNFEFSGMSALVQQLMMLRLFAPPPSGEGEAPTPQELMQRLFVCLGSQVHTSEAVEYPITKDSLKQFGAIECTRPQEFEETLNALAPELEGRDFLGHRLYTTGLDEMMPMMPPGPGMQMTPDVPMSVGIGGGYVFLGTTPAVEQALRSVGEDAAASLAENPAFQRTRAALRHDDVVAWGYADLISSLEAEVAVLRMQREQFEQDLTDEDPELAEEILEAQAGRFEQAMQRLGELDYDLLRQYVGPLAWEVIATDEGFVAHSYLLATE